MNLVVCLSITPNFLCLCVVIQINLGYVPLRGINWGLKSPFDYVTNTLNNFHVVVHGVTSVKIPYFSPHLYWIQCFFWQTRCLCLEMQTREKVDRCSEGNVCKTIFADITARNDIPREGRKKQSVPQRTSVSSLTLVSVVWVRWWLKAQWVWGAQLSVS